MTCGPGSPGTRPPAWSAAWRRCGPGPATSSAMPPASRCASWAGAPSSSTPSSSAPASSSPRSSPLVPPACSPCTVPGLRHCRPAPGRRRGSPGAAALRGGLGAPVRGRPDPGIVGESHSSPPQSRRRPPGQPRPMADRAHTDERPSADSHLCRAAHQGRLAGERDHPLPEALRRPRGLPPPPRRRLNANSPGTA